MASVIVLGAALFVAGIVQLVGAVMSRGAGHIVLPVSYTHLDVYKRQVLSSAGRGRAAGHRRAHRRAGGPPRKPSRRSRGAQVRGRSGWGRILLFYLF